MGICKVHCQNGDNKLIDSSSVGGCFDHKALFLFMSYHCPKVGIITLQIAGSAICICTLHS
uniref:Uncharacterized protein n=1 Tax=Rhizophora mucronata TaxID=61149 RepID=A0A2P2NVJ5_RHIMU